MGGGERHQIDYFESIDYKKYVVCLGTRKKLAGIFEALELPLEVVVLPDVGAGDGFWLKFKEYFKFFRFHQPDYVVFNQYWLKSFSLPELMAASLITRGHVAMIIHDCPPVSSSKRERFFQRMLCYTAQQTVAVSNTVKETLVKLHRFPGSRVKVVYHGVDVDKFCPSPQQRARVRRQYVISDADIVIISTASFWPWKRLDRLIDAFAVLARERDDIQLVLAGDGPEREKLCQRAEALGPNARKIKFLGYQKEVLHYLQMSDIFTLTSDTEGLPIACLEAMSCGLISVVTDCGGCAEIVKNGYNGFLVEKSAVGLLAGINKALGLTVEAKRQLRENAFQDTRRRFNLKSNIHTGLGLFGLTPLEKKNGN